MILIMYMYNNVISFTIDNLNGFFCCDGFSAFRTCFLLFFRSCEIIFKLLERSTDLNFLRKFYCFNKTVTNLTPKCISLHNFLPTT